MNKKDKEKIVKLVTEVSDTLALKEIYRLTKDPLIEVILSWKKQLDNGNRNIFNMYNEMVTYIFRKYELD